MKNATAAAIAVSAGLFGAGLMGYAHYQTPPQVQDAPASVTVQQGTPNPIYFDHGSYTMKSHGATVICTWAASKFSSDTISVSCVDVTADIHNG